MTPFVIHQFFHERRPRFIWLELDSRGRVEISDALIRVLRPAARA